jgi:hypothetical protein
MSRRLRFALALASALGLASTMVGTVSAKTILGNDKPNTLLGTPAADVIYGKSGNDRIYGRGGNDRIYGGPGADTISCGPGTDAVYADKGDKIAKDCERVIGRPKPGPPPAAPAPPPPPPPPPAPVGPKVIAARYCGFTNQGKSICFDVTSAGIIQNVRTESIVDCASGRRFFMPISTTVETSVLSSDGSFSFAYMGPVENGGPDFANINMDYALRGTVDAAGAASGTLAMNSISFDYKGTHETCSAAPFGWTAKAGA